MATQVILLERVDNLGNLGDVVSVKPGYARNYLLPQKKALRASKENIAYFEARKKTLEADNEKLRKEAEKLAKKLEGAKASLIRQASEGGQLFGSVTSRDIAQVVSEQTGETVTRTMVQINQNFKSIGLFPVQIALHPEVKVNVVINIARSAEEAKIQAETGRALVADEAQAFADEAAEQAGLENVLEDDALEAEKARSAQEEQDASEAEAKSKAKSAARASKKAAKASDSDEDPAGEAEDA